MQQLEFDFAKETEVKQVEFPEEIYLYGKYMDKFLDLFPKNIGWTVARLIRDFPTNTRYFIKNQYQKLRYGSCHSYVFSLNTHIAKTILPHLKYYKKVGKVGIPTSMLPDGYPFGNYPDGPNDPNYEKVKLAEDEASKRWDAILDDIIFAFEYTVNEDEMLPDIVDDKKNLPEYFAKVDEFNARKKKGLAYFAEHYDSLWI